MIEKKINKIATHLFQTINSSKNQSSITFSSKWGGNEQAKTATSMEQNITSTSDTETFFD